MIMFAGSVWGAFAKDYDSFLASRIISGFGMAPYEILVQCTIGDLYFVHQRATRIAAWNLCLLCGIAGGALISGYIIQVSPKFQVNSPCADRAGYWMEMDLRHLCHPLRHLRHSRPPLRPRNGIQPALNP